MAENLCTTEGSFSMFSSDLGLLVVSLKSYLSWIILVKVQTDFKSASLFYNTVCHFRNLDNRGLFFY